MTDKVTEKHQKEINVKPMIVKKSKSKLWMGWGLIILLILVLAISGFYALLQVKDSQENQRAKLANDDIKFLELSKQLSSIQSQLASTQTQLTSVNTEVVNTENIVTHKLQDFSKLHEEKLKQAHSQLSESILKLQRQLGKTRGDWFMADAEYLLSVANQRLYLVGDLKTTTEALKAADQRLRESGDVAAFKVREQIAKEISALKEVTINDVVGSYARLQLLISKIEQLALILPYAKKPLVNTKDKKTAKNSDGLVEVVLKQLDGYATVRHSGEKVENILSQEQAKLIKQQLSIKLEMIKISLIQENKILYETSVNDALKWLKLHFMSNKLANNFADELNLLNKSQIYSKFPDISRSLKMLRDISKLRIETDKALDKDEKEVKPQSSIPLKTSTVTQVETANSSTKTTPKPISKKTSEDSKNPPVVKSPAVKNSLSAPKQ